jgi:hypothetical protein
LYLLPTRLSMTAIHEHTEMRQVAARLSKEEGTPVKLPSYYQVRREIHRLSREPDLVAVREGAKSIPRARESASSFALSIPAPALVTQVDEHSLELYVVTPDGITVASRVHAAVLVCVKTAVILGAVLSLGPLKEEEYMRLVKMALEPKDQQVVRAGCQHAWPCYGFNHSTTMRSESPQVAISSYKMVVCTPPSEIHLWRLGLVKLPKVHHIAFSFMTLSLVLRKLYCLHQHQMLVHSPEQVEPLGPVLWSFVITGEVKL